MRALIAAVAIACLGAVGSLQAQEFKAGVHYVELPAQAPTQDAERIEVTELFWYGCGGCNAFEPYVQSWKNDLPEDTYLRLLPAVFGGGWDLHAQLYFTLESLGKEDEARADIFAAMHKQGKRLANQEEMLEVLAPHGVDAESFDKAWNSFGVTNKMRQAGQLARSYRATGVPTLIVNGKYVIQNQSVSGYEEILEIADYLVEKERQAL